MAYNNVKVKARQMVKTSSQTQPLGIVSAVPMNEWNSSVSYEKLNIVTYKNQTFIAKIQNDSIEPLVTEGWENVWMPLLSGVEIYSIVVEYASSDTSSSEPPQEGWSAQLPAFKASKFLWTRTTISYTDGAQTVFYSVGVMIAPTKTSELNNDGDGTSPFATESGVTASIEVETERAESAEQANAKGIEANAQDIATEITRAKGVENGLNNRVTTIETKIPSGASATDQLTTHSFVNSSINALAAFYITYNAAGNAFPSKAALTGATTFYQGGKPRVPTQNDYAIVLADETQAKGVDGSYPTTRYSYQGGTYPSGQWSFQYIVNNTSLTQAQVDALNSGINAAGVAQINTNKNDIAALKSLGTVRYDIAQSLTAAQQQQARANLGAGTPYSLPTATATTLGGVKSSTTGTDGTDYKVQVNADGTMKVNVPQPDLTNYVTTDTEQDIMGTKRILSDNGITVLPSGVAEGPAAQFLFDRIRTGIAYGTLLDNSTDFLFPKGKSGKQTFAMLEDIKWANIPDKPTIPTIPNLTRTVSGSGNAVTDISVSGHEITVTKGETFAKNADLTSLTTRVTTIEGKIPTQASATNQLADKAFVNSTVQTATANFRGNWATWAAVPTPVDSYPADYAGGKTPTVNDYLVVQDASGYSGKTLSGTWRFKYSGTWATNGKNGWQPEYQVNETPLTSAQLSALNSGATSTIIGQITTNKNDITAIKTKNTEQDAAIVTAQSAAEAAQKTANGKYTKPSGGIPKTDFTNSVQTSLGKADTAVQPATLNNYVTTNTPQTIESEKRYTKPITVTDAGLKESVSVMSNGIMGVAQGGYYEVSQNGFIARNETVTNDTVGYGPDGIKVVKSPTSSYLVKLPDESGTLALTKDTVSSKSVYLLEGGDPIEQDTDLNTLKTVGNYFGVSNLVYSFKNCPVANSFTMKVYFGTLNDHLTQEIIDAVNYQRYVREISPTVKSWTKITLTSAEAFLAAHPVKSLYSSDDPTSPAQFAGGSWEDLGTTTTIKNGTEEWTDEKNWFTPQGNTTLDNRVGTITKKRNGNEHYFSFSFKLGQAAQNGIIIGRHPFNLTFCQSFGILEKGGIINTERRVASIQFEEDGAIRLYIADGTTSSPSYSEQSIFGVTGIIIENTPQQTNTAHTWRRVA